LSSKSRARGTQRHTAWAVVGVSLLAVGAAALSVAAIAHAQPDPPSVPDLVVGSSSTPTISPTPTTAPEPVEGSAPLTLPPVSAAQQRFLLIDTIGTIWRGVAGSCTTGEAPIVERSADSGATWNDVTPSYLGITQLAGLFASSPGEAELVAAVGGCSVQGLRTYTEGEFWEAYPEVLPGKAYLPPGNGSAVASAAGAPAAPCTEPASLSVDGTTAALICDAQPYVWAAGSWPQWVPVPAAPARAVLVSGGTLTLARATADCTGVAVSTTSVTDPAAFQTTCQPGLDPAAPATLSADPSGGVVLWSGDTFTRVT
jgi:hypothetical protein